MVPPPELVTCYRDPGKQANLLSMVDDLLNKHAIREISHSEPVHFNRVFLVPKKNGKMRLVIDLSLLNPWLDCPTFSLDHAQVIREALAQHMWATSIDLSDAYLHIPVNPKYWKYLVFQIGNRRFQFMVLPFGLNTAPRVFSEVMKALKRWARLNGMLLFQYLDDWLLLHLVTQTLTSHTMQLVQRCQRLGLLVNHAKSEMVPTQEIVFLGGDYLNCATGMIYPTQARFRAICDKVALGTVQGSTLAARTPGSDREDSTVRSAPLQDAAALVQFQPEQRNQALSEGVHPLSGAENILWWIDPVNVLKGVAINRSAPSVHIQTDASTTGINCQGQILSGHWSQQEALDHINFLEMRTVLIACHRLLHRVKGKTVLFLIDNQTVSYIQK